ncbi:MAG: hypothetical protein KatS3mg105_1669 [Gemmatales bacterium]|nr:MAG: hypothetical protein KatS3mg105_1669 [Gemmatales bacterium]
MRVTYVINSLLRGDGVGNSIVALARVLRRMGAELQILCEHVAQPPADLADCIFAANAHEFATHQDWKHADLVLFDYAVYYPLVEAIRQPTRGKKVFVFHGVTPPAFWRYRRGMRAVKMGTAQIKLARFADFAVAASSFTAKELIQNGVSPERVVVLPYAVQTDRFRPEPADRWLKDHFQLHGFFVLLYVGRMAANKRIDVLVRGLAELKRLGFPARLLLVGDHAGEHYLPETFKAERLAQKLGVGDRVIFTGKVSDALLPRFYNLADIYVSASEHEGFGIPLAEAMACGKPVVAAYAAAVPSVVGPGGRFFPVGDHRMFAQHVAALLQSLLASRTTSTVGEYERYALAAMAQARQFSEDSYGRRWSRFLEQVLAA